MLYLAQLPQLVSGSGCILLLGGELLLLLFQLAFQDGNRVTLLRSLPARGGTSVGTTITGPIPSNPTRVGSCPLLQGKNSAPVPKSDLWGQPTQNQGTFPPLRTSRGSVEPRRQAATSASAALPCARYPGRCPLSPSGSR